jgi:autotransporter-associated beta strand protein
MNPIRTFLGRHRLHSLLIAFVAGATSLSASPGSALRFDGTGAVEPYYLAAAGRDGITIEFWFRADANNGTLGIMGDPRSIAPFELALRNGNEIHAALGYTNQWFAPAMDIPFLYDVGRWYHLAFVLTRSNFTYYINGAPYASGGVFVPSDAQVMAITYRLGSTGRPGEDFVGALDEVRLWNRPRTAEEIATHYNRPLEETMASSPIFYSFDFSAVQALLNFNESSSGTFREVVTEATFNLTNGVSRIASGAGLTNPPIVTQLFWDPVGTPGDGVFSGGTGTWNRTTLNWSSRFGGVNFPFSDLPNRYGFYSRTVYQPNPITVAPDVGTLAPGADLEFWGVDGKTSYELSGAPLTLSAGTTIRSRIDVTFSNELRQAHADLGFRFEAVDSGTLWLMRSNHFTGPIYAHGALLGSGRGSFGLGDDHALGSGPLRIDMGGFVFALEAARSLRIANNIEFLPGTNLFNPVLATNGYLAFRGSNTVTYTGNIYGGPGETGISVEEGVEFLMRGSITADPVGSLVWGVGNGTLDLTNGASLGDPTRTRLLLFGTIRAAENPLTLSLPVYIQSGRIAGTNLISFTGSNSFSPYAPLHVEAGATAAFDSPINFETCCQYSLTPFIKSGAGTLVMNTANPGLTNGFVIEGGTVRANVDGALGPRSVTVKNGGRLTGTGPVLPPVGYLIEVMNGGVIAPEIAFLFSTGTTMRNVWMHREARFEVTISPFGPGALSGVLNVSEPLVEADGQGSGIGFLDARLAAPLVTAGPVFIVVNRGSGNGPAPQFAGLPEGATLWVGEFGGTNYYASITYNAVFNASEPASGGDIALYNFRTGPPRPRVESLGLTTQGLRYRYFTVAGFTYHEQSSPLYQIDNFVTFRSMTGTGGYITNTHPMFTPNVFVRVGIDVP